MEETDPKNFLEELLKEKKTIEKYIKKLEESIYDNETKYLQNTVNGGTYIYIKIEQNTYGEPM